MTALGRDIHNGSSYRPSATARMKNPAQTAQHADRSRRWFRDLLWRAFPAPSERAVAEMASRALGVSPRQVRNWLRCEHDASLRYVTAVMLLTGAECVFDKIARRP